MTTTPPHVHAEPHKTNRSGWLRAAVMGANDGIVSTASLIIGVAAAGTGHQEILLAGVAGLVAGALSMAAGEYVSVSSQADIEKADLALEQKSLDENHESETSELAEIYESRGLEPALARTVAIKLMAHDALGAHARDEIGISEITPIICDRSERKVIKIDRYQRILQSALKQSLKAYLPILNDPVPLKDFIASQTTSITNKFIAHCEKKEKNSLKSVLKPNDDVLILIGPEGDFSSEEITFALDNDFKAVSLGTSRLRTETAAIVACHSVAFINE